MITKFKGLILLFLILSSLSLGALELQRPVAEIRYTGLASKEAKEASKTVIFNTKIGRYLLAKDLKEDIEQLYSTGYFEKIDVQSIIEGRKHILSIEVKENPKIKLVEVKRSETELAHRVQKAFERLVDEPFNPLRVQAMQTQLSKQFLDEGYDFFEFLYIDFVKDSQTLEIVINEGIIESLEFEGLTAIKEFVLLREMQQQPGEVFNSKFIQQDRDRLTRLGYFTNVSSPKFKEGSKENSIAILFEAKEKKTNRVEGGIERDQSQYFLFGSLINNHVFINSDSIATKVETNFESSLYSMGYRQPWLFNRYRINSSISAYSKQFEESVQSQITTSLRRGYLFSLRYPLREKLYLESSLKFEDASLTEDSSDPLFIDPYSIRSLILKLNYSSIRNYSNPKGGYYWNVTFERGNDIGFTELGGIQFDNFVSSLATFKALSKRGTVGFRAQYGRYTPNTGGLNTFEDEYFVVGGSNSVRGYNESDFPFTGTRKLVFNLEYRHDLSDSFQGVLFYDRGLAANRTPQLSELKHGYGIGFRYITPIGPIRLDVATTQEENYYIHLGLGQVF